MRMFVRPLALVLLIPALATAQNWPGYRGPGGQGHAESKDLPTEWSEDKNVAWKVPIDGKAWSSPVVWGERVWVTNANAEGTKLSVICVDRNSGEVLYDRLLCTVEDPQFCHDFNSYASPTPVLEEGFVYLTFGAPYTACLEQESGKVVWERKDFECDHFRGAGSSPILYDDFLILPFDGADHQFIVAMDKQTGETAWRTERSVDFQDLDENGKPKRDGDLRKAYATPLIHNIDGRDVLLCLGSMALYAYEPRTGDELWRVEAIGIHSGSACPVIGHGLIFEAMGWPRSKIVAVKPGGTGDVTGSHVVWEYDKTAPKKPSLILEGDLLFAVDDGGIAVCLDAKTGEEVWKERLGGNFSASPIIADGKIYAFDEEGTGTVFEAAREFKQVARNTLEAGCMASPAVSGDLLIVRTKKALYGIKKL